MLFWEKKPVKEGKKGGKKEGCFKEHWKVVLWVVVMVAAITFIVVDAAVNWSSVYLTVITLNTCAADQFITPFSREIVVSDTSKCHYGLMPYTLDLTRYKYVESIEIGNNCFSSRLNLNGLSRLKSIRIGDDNFEYEGDLNLIGLKKLESVVIGKKSFLEGRWDPRFHLKDCPKLKELRIGGGSFRRVRECVIENVPSLEVIEMGDLDENSYNFRSASLELKSILIHSE